MKHEKGSCLGSVKARLNGSNMLVKHNPTLSSDVERCLISVEWSWMRECLNVSNTIKHTAMKWRETDYAVFLIAQAKMLGDNG